MSLVYFDASALVKLFVEEPGSDLVAELWDGSAVATCCRLAHPEVRAALAAARRSGRLEDAAARGAVGELERMWLEVRVIELTSAVASAAGHLVGRHPLSGADAVHLASALTLIEASPLFASWDARLGAAAHAEGLRVVPAPS